MHCNVLMISPDVKNDIAKHKCTMFDCFKVARALMFALCVVHGSLVPCVVA